MARASRAVERGDHAVLAVAFVPGHDAGRGRDAGGVDRLELVGVGQDVAELAGEEVDLIVGELEMGQRGDFFNLRASELSGHGEC